MLTLIIGNCAIVLQQAHPDDPFKRRFEGIKEAGEKAALFVSEILALSKGESTIAAVVDLSAVVASMKGLLSRIAGPQIQLIFDLDPEAGSVKTHLGQVEQVLLNLVINAREAIPLSGTITLRTHPAGPYISLVVADTGSGIPAQDLPHIFEPFFTTKEHGTGLGLATVYEIVKRSGGETSVQSQPGRGTSFRLLFPRANE
jgi:two-component system cell cycle sensor histidine kinase/response regulator CckA